MTEIEFDEATHTYKIRGRVVPSVTQVLREVGIIDPMKYAPGSAERGTAVHLACQLYDENDLDETSLDPAIRPYLDGWRLFIERERFVSALIEYRVGHDLYSYAGTIDRTGTMGGETVVLDIKTGAPEKWAALQLAGYVEAIGTPGVRRLTVHLPGDGTYRLKEYSDPTDRSVFLAAVSVCHWKGNHA